VLQGSPAKKALGVRKRGIEERRRYGVRRRGGGGMV